MEYNHNLYPPIGDALRRHDGSSMPSGNIIQAPRLPLIGDISYITQSYATVPPPLISAPVSNNFASFDRSWVEPTNEEGVNWISNSIRSSYADCEGILGVTSNFMLPSSVRHGSLGHDANTLNSTSTMESTTTISPEIRVATSSVDLPGAGINDNSASLNIWQTSGMGMFNQDALHGGMNYPSGPSSMNIFKGSTPGQTTTPPPPYNSSFIGYHSQQSNPSVSQHANILSFLSSSSPNPLMCQYPSANLETLTTHSTPNLYQNETHRSVSRTHSNRHVRRSQPQAELMGSAFTDDSYYPDYYRRSCLNRIISLGIHLRREEEPYYNSPEGASILGIPLHNIKNVRPNTSIYILFINSEEKRCLICGEKKSCIPRLLGCIRAHLGHRPFACSGNTVGCKKCVEGEEPARFFTCSLLRDHITGPINKSICPHPQCNAQLRRGGVRRHWEAKHKDEEFPLL